MMMRRRGVQMGSVCQAACVAAAQWSDRQVLRIDKRRRDALDDGENYKERERERKLYIHTILALWSVDHDDLHSAHGILKRLLLLFSSHREGISAAFLFVFSLSWSLLSSSLHTTFVTASITMEPSAYMSGVAAKPGPAGLGILHHTRMVGHQGHASPRR